jgi:hypothetical protein
VATVVAPDLSSTSSAVEVQPGEGLRELTSRMPDMVKGAGMVRQTGRLEPLADGEEVDERSLRAAKAVMQATKRGYDDPGSVLKSWSPDFMSPFQRFMQSNPMQLGINSLVSQISRVLSTELGKDVTLTSPLTSGLVPFDLVAPTRLIYYVASPLRNLLPRTQGQGTARKVKVLTGIAGSQTGGSAGNPVAWDIPEFPGGGSFSNWPVQLPSGDTPAGVDVSIPYKFFGRSEQVSWLSQFAGQGFEDVAALANLILMQKAMLAEEYMLLSGTGVALNQPAAPTVASRTAGTGETAWSVTANNTYVVVTALTYFGETQYAAGNVTTQANGAGNVYDVTIAPVQGALAYNVYAATGAANPGRAGFWLYKGRSSTTGFMGVGATKITLQGTAPSSGANPPAADSGTGASTRYEGLLSQTTGWAQNASGANIYPAGFAGGYINQSVGTVLNTAAVFNALAGIYDNSASSNAASALNAAGFRADPELLVTEAFDQVNLTNDILSKNAQGGAYQLFISQDEIGQIKAGAAVSQFQNPFTRKLVRILVHPWLNQGTAFLLSLKLPTSFNNVNNAFEVVNVQDYVSIQWPVIDVTFRYSIFLYGALVGYAPQFSAVLQGLQKSASAPFA